MSTEKSSNYRIVGHVKRQLKEEKNSENKNNDSNDESKKPFEEDISDAFISYLATHARWSACLI